MNIFFALALLMAQPQKVIRAGQGPDLEIVRSWPKINAHADMADPEIAAEAERYVRELAQQERFSGAVLIEHEGKVLLRSAAGYAEREFNVPNAPESKFNLGSINKLFTAIAIRQLIEQGKLTPDDTVARLLPDVKIPSAAKITVAHLLNHSSGLGDIFTDRWDCLRGTLTGIRSYFPLFENDPLQFEPGTKRSYSNAGYVVLGAIIEKVSGESYYDYVREHVYKPAGMNSSDSYALADVVAQRATGYTRRGGLRANVLSLPARGSSAGGGYSTVDDLLRFAHALLENKLLPETATRRLAGEGLGVAGGSPGVNAALEINVPKHFVIVVLTNSDPPGAELTARNLRALFGDVDEDE